MSKILSLILLALFILSLTPTSLAAPMPMNKAPTLHPTGTKTIDGNPSDWTGTPPSTYNSWAYSNGEWIWNDTVNDERNDFAQIHIDGQSWDWDNNYGKYFLIEDTHDPDPTSGTNITGANLTKLFVAWDDTYLYIGLETNNKANWATAYGIGIDVNGTATGYNDTQGTSDAWGRKITFHGHAIDYELYFYWSDSDAAITSHDFCNWTGSGWGYYSLSDIGGSFAYSGDSTNGLQFLEIEIPWSALKVTPGSPISISAWVAGGSDSSAVDSVPYDPTVEDNLASNGEWSDQDTFTVMQEVNFTIVNKILDTRVDLVQWRISGDTNDMYMMFQLENTTGANLGESGAPYIAVAIDLDRTAGSGATAFPGGADTSTSNDAAYEYVVVINLADSRLSGRTYTNTSGALDDKPGAIFTILDSNGNYVGAGTGEIAVNLDQNFVELAIPWGDLGFSQAPNNQYLRFTLMTARGYSTYGSSGGTWDISGSSDALDVMTTAASTWDEVSDGVIDYYADVYFSNGEPAVPPASLQFVSPTPAAGSTLLVGDTVDFKVELQVAGSPEANQSIWVYVNGVNQTSLGGKTGSDGTYGFTLTIDPTLVGTLNVTAYYPGNTSLGTSPARDERDYTVKYGTRITGFQINATSASLGSGLQATGTLEYYDGSAWQPLGGETIEIINTNTSTVVATGTTQSDGTFTITFNAPTYIGEAWEYVAHHPESTNYNESYSSPSYLNTYGSRIIDGNPSDWVGLLPPTPNMWNVTNNELVWRDKINDTRTDADSTYANASIVSDIEQFRVTTDEYYIYFELTFQDIQKLGVAGAPIIDVAIDRDQVKDSGQYWLPGYSDTKVGSSYHYWEYAIRLDLSFPSVSHSGAYRDGSSWGNPLTVTNSTWDPQANATYAWFAVDNTTDTVEIAVPWDAIGGAPASGDELSFVVITGVGKGDGSGNFFGVSGSNALDAVTGEPTTWDEVQDGDVDYVLTVQVGVNYMVYPGSSVFIFWISPTPDNQSHVPANVSLSFGAYARDSLYNKLSHFSFSVINVTTGKVIENVEADGLGKIYFNLTLPVGEQHLRIVFNGSGLIPSGASKELVLYAEPIYPTNMTVTYRLTNDADGNGYITPGDTVTFTVKITYYNSSAGAYLPLSGANITLNSTEAGVDVNLTTDSTGTVTYDWTVPDLGGPSFIRFDANYMGNATAAGTPRFLGVINSTHVPYYIARIIDGNISDWTGTPPTTTPGIDTSGMELIINDPVGDERTDWRADYNWPHVTDLDIVQARLLMDKYELYGMLEFASNISPYKIIMVVIDIEPFNDTGTTWLPGYADTQLATIENGEFKLHSWDYVVWINPGYGYVDAYNSSYYHFYNVGGLATVDNAKTLEFYAKWSSFGVDGSTLAGKHVRVWILSFANDYGNIWDPSDQGVSTVGSDVYDIAGLAGTINVAVYDNDGSVGNDAWPAQSHWVMTGFEFSLSTDNYAPTLTPTATVTSATVVEHSTTLAIGETGNATIAVSPVSEGNIVILKDHDTGKVIWTGITSFDGVARLGLRFSTKGTHTVDVYVDGNLLTSFTVEVLGYLSHIVVKNISLTDTDGDGLPDQITVEGNLTFYNGTEWLPAAGNTTDISLVYAYYNLTASAISDTPALVIDNTYKIDLGTATAGSDGGFTLTVNLPSLPAGYPEGGYIVDLYYAGDDQRIPAENNSLVIAGIQHFVPLYSNLPSDPFTITGTSPGVYLDNGQLLYVDPTGDYATDYLTGTKIVDLQDLWVGVSSNYLVVKAKYDGDMTGLATHSGNSLPFLVILLDTTPNDPTDGVDSFLWLIPGYAYGFTPHTYPNPPYSNQVAGTLVAAVGTSEVKYTHAIIITPVEPSNPESNYIVWLVYAENGAILGKPLGILKLSDLANGEFIAYLPLSAIGISSVQDVRLWTVSGEIYTGGFIYSREIIPTADQGSYPGQYWHTMVYDVPGTGFLPSTANENIYAAVYNWSLLLTLDPTNGFTKLYGRLVEYSLPDSVAEGKLFVGPAANHTFTYTLMASESDYHVIGGDVVLHYNTTTYTSTSGANGLVTFQFKVPNADAGKDVLITFTGTGAIELASAPSYTLHVAYYTKIVNSTMIWRDNDNDGYISRGDVLSFYTKVEVYDENGNWVPMPGINVTYWIYSTPYLLGWNTTDNNGVSIFNYTVTGNEGIVGTHNIVTQAGGNDPFTSTTTVASGGFNVKVFMQPAPEPTILPVLLLAAILLFIIIKKRR